MSDVSHLRRGEDWAPHEIDAVIADYFEMLKLELLGQPFVKAHRAARLQELTGRSKGSIEFKRQNISAVLVALGERWIAGYKPMANFQKALLEGVERYLSDQDFSQIATIFLAPEGLSEETQLFIDMPPARIARDEPTPPVLARLLRKFDPASRDERNRALGKAGEELALYAERNRLRAEGRDDLGRRVEWVSQEKGDGAGFDILSFNSDGSERLLEVKTTMGEERTPFFISENELSLSNECPNNFRLLRIYNFHKHPRAFEIAPPLGDWVTLNASIYRAGFDAP